MKDKNLTWKDGFEMYHNGEARPIGELIAQKGWDDAKFGYLPNGALPIIDHAERYNGPETLYASVRAGYAQ